MRKNIFTFLLPLGVLFAIGCNQQEKSENKIKEKSTQVSKTEVDSSKVYKREAITLLDQVNSTMRKAVKGEMSQKEANKEINPKMDNYLRFMSKMLPIDTLAVQNYRVQEVNKIIDLQMQLNQD